MSTFDSYDTSNFQVAKNPQAIAYLKSLPVQDQVFFQYSQYAKGKYNTKACCAVFNYLIILSSQFNKELSREQIDDCIAFAIQNYGLNLKGNNSAGTMAKAVIKRWNTKFEEKAVFMETTWFSEAFYLAIEKGLGIATGIQGYDKDAGVNFFLQTRKGTITGEGNMRSSVGHIISMWSGYIFRDSDSKKSVAKCTENVLKKLVKDRIFFPTVRIVLPLQEINGGLTEDKFKVVQKYLNTLGDMWNNFENERPAMAKEAARVRKAYNLK